MIKKSVVAILSILFMTVSCSHAKFYVLGVDVEKVIKTEGIEMMVLGAAASFITHLAGHYIAGELVGADIEQQGNREIVLNHSDVSTSDKRWFARGGFLTQTLVNTALVNLESTRKSKFTRGFTLGTVYQIGTYPLWLSSDEWGDIDYLNNNDGEGTTEWSLYMGVAVYNCYKIVED